MTAPQRADDDDLALAELRWHQHERSAATPRSVLWLWLPPALDAVPRHSQRTTEGAVDYHDSPPLGPWPGATAADSLRPHRGRAVAVLDGRVIFAGESLAEVCAWLDANDRAADSVFVVPLDPAADPAVLAG